jgi:hypothetical protein
MCQKIWKSALRSKSTNPHGGRSEGRRSKAERRPKPEIRNPKPGCPRMPIRAQMVSIVAGHLVTTTAGEGLPSPRPRGEGARERGSYTPKRPERANSNMRPPLPDPLLQPRLRRDRHRRGSHIQAMVVVSRCAPEGRTGGKVVEVCATM